MGVTNKQKAIRAAYFADPILCRHCQTPILPKPGQKLAEIRKRTFCTKSCAAIFNYAVSRFPKRAPDRFICYTCGVSSPKVNGQKRKFCPPCSENYRTRLDRATKGAVTARRLRSHTIKQVKGRRRVCESCGYSKHVQIAHVRAVADFPDSATLGEINHPTNLLLLCPNCHWEHDHPTEL